MPRKKADIPAPAWAQAKTKRPRKARPARLPPRPAPPPPRPVEQAAPASAKARGLGPPPGDLFAGAKWLGQLLLISAEEAVNDDKMTPSARRKELRTIAASYRGLEDKIRKFEIDEAIRRDREQLEKRKRGAALEPVPGK